MHGGLSLLARAARTWGLDPREISDEQTASWPMIQEAMGATLMAITDQQRKRLDIMHGGFPSKFRTKLHSIAVNKWADRSSVARTSLRFTEEISAIDGPHHMGT